MDDLLDLSWSEQPAKKPPLLSGSSSSSFDMLSRPQGQSYYSGASTPLAASKPASHAGSSANLADMRGTPGLRTTASPHPSTGARATSPLQGGGGGQDAFSDLLGMSGGTGGGKKLSMAEKQAQLAAQRAKEAEEERNRWGDGAFWDQLGGGFNPTPPAPAPVKPVAPAPIAQPTPAKAKVNLGPALQATSSAGSRPTSAAKKMAGSFWDTDSLLGQPEPKPKAASKSPSPSAKSGSSFWDDDTLLNGSSRRAPTPKTSSARKDEMLSWDNDDGGLLGASGSTSKPTPVAADPWDFDALSSSVPKASASSGRDNDNDDLLGELGRPVRRTSPRAEPQASSRTSSGPTSRPTSRPSARANSPPPHVIGQIVEMGFPPDRARAALAATATGEDVQAALESLLASRGNTPAAPRDEEDEWDRERAAARRYEEDERDREAARRARHATRRAGPSREAVRPRADEYGGTGGVNTDELAKHADQLISQASEIGASMLTKASMFWSQGKEKALKVYEEQRKAYDAGGQDRDSRRAPPTDGRPRWMVEAEQAEQRDAGLPPSADFGDAALGFHDSEDEGDARPKPKPQAQQVRPEPRKQRSDAPPLQSVGERTANLLSGEPALYISPHRHAKNGASPALRASPAPRTATPARPSSPLRERTLVSASNSALSSAAQHKTVGNEHFKLGRFAEAETAYSRAISALPGGHLHLVPLHNNRAATWLKLGEPGRAAADCGIVIELIGPTYHPKREAPLPATPDAEGVKLGDALVKATAKRAQAHEMGEKWKLALEDWERVLGYDAALGGATLKSQASDGVRRSKGMLAGGSAPSGGSASALAPKKPTPRATPRPTRPVDVASSAAVSELRAAAAVQEAEDEQRLALKDAVDARLTAWRTGKETNIRALLASLDLVLWPAVLLKVGMHELVTDKQVKIKYMKVIARLHPDKLAQATVEQRMMANGVFGTLSEAWAAFNA